MRLQWAFSSVILLIASAHRLLAQETASWNVIQNHILNQNCTVCHLAGSSFASQSDLVLTADQAYSQLVDVLTNNTAARNDGLLRVSSSGGGPGLFQSFLWEKINVADQAHFYEDHPHYGAIMPLGLPSLTHGELAFIRDWIWAGAPENGVVADPVLLEDTSRFEPPEFVPLDPPSQGIQFHLGPFDVWPSEVQDREFLYFEPYVTPEDLFVDRYQISYRPGSHHFILYNYPEGQLTPSPNVYRDLRDQNGVVDLPVALQLGNLFPFQMFVGTQTPYIDYHLPDGVALRLPPGSGFDLNSHSVNRSNSAQIGEVYVNLHTVDLEDIEYVAEPDNFGDFDIFLPPNQVTTLTKIFTFSETRRLLQIWSHSHEHTLEFRIEGVGGEQDGKLLYWTNDWEHPPILELDPPLIFQAGDQVRLVTTYDNWTDEPITFGPLSSDEMQFMFYIYTNDPLPDDMTFVGNGSWHAPLNWSPEGLPSTNTNVTLGNSFSATDVTVFLDSAATVHSIDILGSTGTMILEILQGVTFTVADGITVGPGATLKGKGTIVGDIFNSGGTVTAGLPEPHSSLLAVLGSLVLLAAGRRVRYET